jgi:FixJ family two-component response regulator
MHSMGERQHLVAVIDDEEPVRRALARMLQASLYEVLAFPNGQVFLDSLRAIIPDCVLLDLNMPGLTGGDVQRALTETRPSVPVIVMTAHDRPGLREQCLADGAIAFFPKPLRRDSLIPAIDAAIHRRAEIAPLNWSPRHEDGRQT